MEKYKELYRELHNKVYGYKKNYKETELSNFVPMRGCRYDEKIGKDDTVRLMLVGRAVNGWGQSMSIENADIYADKAIELFGANNRFQSEWKMENGEIDPYSWYEKENENGERTMKKYYLSKSPFWDTALKIYVELSSKEYHEHSDLYEDIVWNNIYKIAPLKEGNPSTNLIYAQAETCVKLLHEEMRLLQPTHVLLVVDKSWISWSSRNVVKFDFMKAFDDYECCCNIALKEQDEAIVQCAFAVGSSKVLVTCRPETVSRGDYINAVLSAFENCQNNPRIVV